MTNNINDIGKIIALLSFVIGTCLLAFYLYFGQSNINFGIAIGFIIVAFIINVITILVIVGHVIFNNTNRCEALKACGLMLLNIPVVILYIYIVITFPGNNLML